MQGSMQRFRSGDYVLDERTDFGIITGTKDPRSDPEED
jgi:hypothetical protein